MGWDAEKLLDQFILDYMIKRELHVTAATFAKEANVTPDPVPIQSREGFLREWWAVFSEVYSETTEGSSSHVSTDGSRPNDSKKEGNDKSSGKARTKPPGNDKSSGKARMTPPRPDKFPMLKNSPGEPKSSLPTTALMPSSGVVDNQARALRKRIPRPRKHPGAMEGSSSQFSTGGLHDQNTDQSTEGNQPQDGQVEFSCEEILSLLESIPDEPQNALSTTELIPSSDMVNSQERALPTQIPWPNHPVAGEGSSSQFSTGGLHDQNPTQSTEGNQPQDGQVEFSREEILSLSESIPDEPQNALSTTELIPSSDMVNSQERALPTQIPWPNHPVAGEEGFPSQFSTGGLHQYTTHSTEGYLLQDGLMEISLEDLRSILESITDEPQSDGLMEFSLENILSMLENIPDPPQSALPTTELIPSSDMMNSQERALPTMIPRPNDPVAEEGSSFPDNSQAADHVQNTSVQSALPTAVLMPSSDVVDSVESTPAMTVLSPADMIISPQNVVPTTSQIPELNPNISGSPSFSDKRHQGDI